MVTGGIPFLQQIGIRKKEAAYYTSFKKMGKF
jgi:hypothetical protein